MKYYNTKPCTHGPISLFPIWEILTSKTSMFLAHVYVVALKTMSLKPLSFLTLWDGLNQTMLCLLLSVSMGHETDLPITRFYIDSVF